MIVKSIVTSSALIAQVLIVPFGLMNPYLTGIPWDPSGRMIPIGLSRTTSVGVNEKTVIAFEAMPAGVTKESSWPIEISMSRVEIWMTVSIAAAAWVIGRAWNQSWIPTRRKPAALMTLSWLERRTSSVNRSTIRIVDRGSWRSSMTCSIPLIAVIRSVMKAIVSFIGFWGSVL